MFSLTVENKLSHIYTYIYIWRRAKTSHTGLQEKKVVAPALCAGCLAPKFLVPSPVCASRLCAGHFWTSAHRCNFLTKSDVRRPMRRMRFDMVRRFRETLTARAPLREDLPRCEMDREVQKGGLRRGVRRSVFIGLETSFFIFFKLCAGICAGDLYAVFERRPPPIPTLN
jgi:hypothetical protein